MFYHSNRKVTNTEVGARELAIAVTDLTCQFWVKVEDVGTID